jgi:membrane protease YdiL (CAAX protease family)
VKINIRKIAIFLILTFAVDWLMVSVYLWAGGKWEGWPPIALAIAYMFIPMVMAIIVQKWLYREPLAGPLGISFKVNSWFFVAWFLPPILSLACAGISLLMPGITYTPDMAGFLETFGKSLTPEQMEMMKQQMAEMPVHPIWLGLIQGLIAGTTINAIAGFGEELGWRGLLQQELSPLGFWKSSLLIGFIWGVWHAPLILQGHNYPQHPQIGVIMMIIWCMLMAPVISYIRVKARSVIAAAIFHGTINGTYGLSIMLISGGNDLVTGMTGLAGFIVFAVAGIIIFIFDRRITRRPVTSVLREL